MSFKITALLNSSFFLSPFLLLVFPLGFVGSRIGRVADGALAAGTGSCEARAEYCRRSWLVLFTTAGLLVRTFKLGRTLACLSLAVRLVSESVRQVVNAHFVAFDNPQLVLLLILCCHLTVKPEDVL